MSHWLDDQAVGSAGDAAPTPLQVVARRIARVSPDWADVTETEAVDAHEVRGAHALGMVRAQGVEAIREGWLLHRGASRVASGASADLALLVGDWCYAAGLCTIADEGTLDDVAALAELVAGISSRVGEPIEALEGAWEDTIGAMQHG